MGEPDPTDPDGRDGNVVCGFTVDLVEHAPRMPAGVSRVEIRLGGDTVGDLDYRTCSECRFGVLESVRVATAVRRRGLASHAVFAILSAHPAYQWSTSTITDTAEATAFWTALDWPGIGGTLPYCPHMRRADEHNP
ncbi:hypothetical protein FHX42_002146 [Saccharopolyspora lacisalsi]|uniref:N-acetyltransferase domain-containing protein n=1 Tax=Halosaccharopolyspora lacisalsi TaxID=1000566 RepID=A0A839DVK3_9PSEU|nr:hypothetical protein [Halosaccharopolyspora lacisalsi]MBA8824799.1 hypothetical protein [Halosaccharopolyspora lacisalsi]